MYWKSRIIRHNISKHEFCGQYRQIRKYRQVEISLLFAEKYTKKETASGCKLAAFCGQHTQRRKLLADVKSLHFVDNMHKKTTTDGWKFPAVCWQHVQRRKLLKHETSLCYATNIGKEANYWRQTPSSGYFPWSIQ